MDIDQFVGDFLKTSDVGKRRGGVIRRILVSNKGLTGSMWEIGGGIFIHKDDWDKIKDKYSTGSMLWGIPVVCEIDIATWMRDRFNEGKDPKVIARVEISQYSGIVVTVKLHNEPDHVGTGWTFQDAFENAISD